MSGQTGASRADRVPIGPLDIVLAAITVLVGLGWLVLVLSNNDSVYLSGLELATVIVASVAMAVSVLLARSLGEWALAALGVVVAVVVVSVVPLPSLLAVAWVAYATARHGSWPVMVLSGVLVAMGTTALVSWMASGSASAVRLPAALESLLPTSPLQWLALVTILLLTGVVPWLIGAGLRLAETVTRLRASKRTAEQQQAEALAAWHRAEGQKAAAEAERARADRTAAQESGQARLARDVHDVVGHSLAVILAQAESAQFLDEPDQLHETLANVATAARQSLGEVRQVLGAARGEGPHPERRPWEDIVESVRAAGADVRVTVTGQARPLPPDLETVAYRVLQEMLTNALRHGDLAQPVVVEQAWADRLRLRVRNVAPAEGGQPGPLDGVGLPGMRARVAAVGGDFDFSRIPTAEGEVVTATAWLPLETSVSYQPARAGEAATANLPTEPGAVDVEDTEPTETMERP